MDAVAAAIADPIRREILVMLRGCVLSAGTIAERFDVSRPAVSRHLRVLRESGLIVSHVEGREHRYRLEPAGLEELECWLAALRNPWPGRLDALETEVYRTRRERRAPASQSKAKSRKRSA